jgi:hypothetical protein
MKMEPGLTMMAHWDMDAVAQEATRNGIPTYVLPDTGVVGRESFFEAVRTSLPLDPPLLGTRSWDALSDSLWEGLHALDADRVVIMWPNSATMFRAATADYKMALNVLADVAASLADPSATSGKPKAVLIYVESLQQASEPSSGV